MRWRYWFFCAWRSSHKTKTTDDITRCTRCRSEWKRSHSLFYEAWHKSFLKSQPDLTLNDIQVSLITSCTHYECIGRPRCKDKIEEGNELL